MNESYLACIPKIAMQQIKNWNFEALLGDPEYIM